MKPITPSEAGIKKNEAIPDKMIQAVNELIVSHIDLGGNVTIPQEKIVERFLELTKGEISRREIFEKHYLDFEPLFKKAGWDIEYHKPCYGDSNFKEYFEFKKKGRK